MTWSNDFLELMPSVVGFRKKTTGSSDLYGKSEYAVVKQTRSRVENEAHEVIDDDGNTRSVEGKVYVPHPDFWVTGPNGALVATTGGFIPTTDDRMVLDTGLEVSIVAVARENDGDGLHHLRVHYGR
jgi:hypothetical protein